MRHAKSGWNDSSGSDFERTLNEEGRNAAPKMGALLKRSGLAPNLIIASAAARARETAELVKGSVNTSTDITLDAELYLGSHDRYVRAAAACDVSNEILLLIGHNPTLEQLLVVLTRRTVEFRPAAIAHIEFEIDDWKELLHNPRGNLANFLSPEGISN